MTDNQSFTDQDRDDPAFAANRSTRLETPAGGRNPPRLLSYWNALPQWQRCSELLEWIGLAEHSYQESALRQGRVLACLSSKQLQS